MASRDPSYLSTGSNSSIQSSEGMLPPDAVDALPYPHPQHSYWTKHYESELTRWNWGGYGGNSDVKEDEQASDYSGRMQDGDYDERWGSSSCSESSWEVVVEERCAEVGKEQLDTDILVIGTGLTGTSCVDKLVEELTTRTKLVSSSKAVRITVVEAREFCSGATARNGGHLTPSPILKFSDIVKDSGSTSDAVKSIALEARGLATVLDACETEGWTADVDLVQGGIVVLLATKAQEVALKVQIEGAMNAGMDISNLHWLSAQEAKDNYGAVCCSALTAPGNNIYPLKYVTKLFQRAQARASASENVTLDLYTGTPVTKVEEAAVKGEARWRVVTSRGSFNAKQVLHCTNAHASYLIPSLRSGPSRIIPVRGQVISVDTSKETYWTTAFGAREGDEYFFQRPITERSNGEIILGGCRSAAGKGSPNSGKWGWEMNEVNDSQGSEKVGESLRKFLDWQYPDLGFGDVGKGGAAVAMEWSGVMGYRESGVPIVGRVYDGEEEIRGQYISAGYTGHGMPRAPACGEFLANMVLADFDGIDFTTPDWMPEYYLSRPIKAKRQREQNPRQWCLLS